MSNTPMLSVKNVNKLFPGVKALTDVSIDFYAGEVHILLGENGAGKSTLIKVISGVYQRDSGTIFYNGREVHYKDTAQAMNDGIAVIHQELSVIEDLTVAENIFLGREPRKGWKSFVDKQTMNLETQKILDQLSLDFKPEIMVKKLSTAQRQMVEIAKAVSQNASVVVMDEPTSSLSEQEVESLFQIINRLKLEGVSIIYISHRMKEFDFIGDKVTIMRDGVVVDTLLLKETTQQEMITKMVGRELGAAYAKENISLGELSLEAKGISRKGHFENISLEVHRGEVVGIAGLIGAGRTEVLRGIFGVDRLDGGELWINGKPVHFNSPRDALKMRLALVPEDRREQGLLLNKSIKENISLPSLNKTAKLGFIDKQWEKRVGDEYSRKLNVKTPNAEVMCKKLSGGNQQKVILAKWVLADSEILLLDEPTRGIDVQAKREIYDLITGFAKQGKSILIVSSELPELIGICDKIYVMREGKISNCLASEQFSEEAIMDSASLH